MTSEEKSKLNLQEIAGETAATTVAPVTAESEKKKPGRKKGTKNPSKKTPPSQVIEPVQPALVTVSLHDFLETNRAKIVGRTRINLNIPAIPQGKYGLYISDDSQNAELFLIDDACNLRLENFVPDTIKIEKSGVVASCATRRVYVTKTNVVQFNLDQNGIPTLCRTIKKPNTSGEVGYTDESKEPNTNSIDQIKILIKVVAPTLATKINEMTDLNDIKVAVLEFYTSVRDLNYLIKIDKQIFMACF
jgi:hypothetical protein